MKRPENNKWLDDALKEAFGSKKHRADFNHWKWTHPEAVEMLTSRAKIHSTFRGLQKIRNTIMRSPITKLAAAAIIILAVIITINILDKSAATAYAIEQTIRASHTVRSLHVKGFSPSQDEPIEIWAEFNENGKLENMRVHKPEWMDTEEGTTEIIWKDNKAQVWAKKKNVLSTIDDKNFSTWILNLVEQFDPKLAVGRLEREQKQGKTQVEIKQPSDNNKPIIVTATSKGEKKSPFQRTVLSIDRVTKLVNSVELYQLRDGKYNNVVTFKYYNYNQPIDQETFIFKDIPSDVKREDLTK